VEAFLKKTRKRDCFLCTYIGVLSQKAMFSVIRPATLTDIFAVAEIQVCLPTG
jgi:hypothetical protein